MMRENSSFKFHTLLANCCRRQAALFTLSFVSMLAVLPIGMILKIQSFLRYNWDNNNPETRKYTVEMIRNVLMTQEMANVALIVLAVIAGISMFHYLHSRTQTDFYGALPIRRGQMFAIRVTTGALAVLPIYLLSVAFTCGVCVAYGFSDAIDGTMLACSILAHIAGFLLIYAVSILSAIVCGHTLVSLLVCGWMQFGLYFGWFVVNELLDILYPARISAYTDNQAWLSPPVALFRMTTVGGELWTDDPKYVAYSLVPALGCLIVAAVVFVLSYILCRVRRSENAGSSIAFPVIELPFKLYMTSVIGILCGLVFQAMTGDWMTMFFGIAVGAVVAACVVEIVYDQDFRSLFRRWKSTLIFGVVAAAVFACMAMDVTHWNSNLPDRGDIVAADMTSDEVSWSCSIKHENFYDTVTVYGMLFGGRQDPEQQSGSMLEASENIDAIYASASMGAEAMKGDRSRITEQGTEGTYRYEITFKLKNGRVFRRAYYLPTNTDQIAENSAQVRFSEEYLNSRTAIAQAEKQKNDIVFMMVGNYTDIDTLTVGKQINSKSAIVNILETLKEESMSITKEYAATNAPVAILRVTTQDVLDELEEININRWDYMTNLDGLYDIPVYECETRTLAQIKLYAKGFVTRFGNQKITSIVSTVYNEDDTEEVVHIDSEEIDAWSKKLIPYSFESVIDPVYRLNYDSYYDVKLDDGNVIHCISHQESDEADGEDTGAKAKSTVTNTSTRVIGGADGPTEISVTSSPSVSRATTIALFAVGIVAIVVICLLLRRRKQK